MGIGEGRRRTPSEFKNHKSSKSCSAINRLLTRIPEPLLILFQSSRRPLHFVLDAPLLSKGPLKSPRESGSFVPDAEPEICVLFEIWLEFGK